MKFELAKGINLNLVDCQVTIHLSNTQEKDTLIETGKITTLADESSAGGSGVRIGQS